MSSQVQGWNARKYKANASFVAELGKPVLDLLEPKPGERVLDLGCGDGTLTREIARLGCDVIGVDASSEMVEAARASGVEALLGDATALTFVEEFDAVFSNAALHWIKPPEAAIAAVWKALRPGGRFVGEFGGSGNVATIVGAVEAALAKRGVGVTSPWFFPTAEQYAALLQRGGFSVFAIELFARPTPLPDDVRGWLETFAQCYLNAVPAADREALIAEVVDDLRNSMTDGQNNWYADYVRLRFGAEKPRSAI
jgi:SAM-dependent methyltransferase